MTFPRTTPRAAAPVGPASGVLLGTATYNSANSDWTFTTTTPLTAGYHTILAAFGGDPNFQPSQGFASVQVISPQPAPVATLTTVTPPQQQIAAGSEASFTITVVPATNTGTVPGSDTVTMYDISTNNPTGTVTSSVLLGTATYNSANSDWTFTTTTPLTAGYHTIFAAFGGDANFLASRGLASVQVGVGPAPQPRPPLGNA